MRRQKGKTRLAIVIEGSQMLPLMLNISLLDGSFLGKTPKIDYTPESGSTCA